jgi:flagellar biosynthesis/type III secretory pathway protein FliH
MLSKVFKGGDVRAEPVAWRRAAVPPEPAGKADMEPVDNSEVGRLRTRIVELEAAVEARSRQSYAAGVRAGEESARKSLESEMRETVEQLATTIADLAETRGETIRRAEADMVRLSIEIARRVLHSELSADGSALESLIKAALEKLQAQEVYRVRVHPDQEKAVRSCLDQTGRGQAIAVIGDPVQPKGGAVFEIGRGALDASMETQLAEIEHGLMNQLEARV